jgi:hypothetical protein
MVCRECPRRREHFVSEEDLKNLLDILIKIKEDNKLASELLPTTSGFFFGNTEYDEWYFKDVETTIEILEDLFKEKGDRGRFSGDFYYSSSW